MMQKRKLQRFTFFFAICSEWLQMHVKGLNASSTDQLGSNRNCDGKVRVRRDWDYISRNEKELYLQAIETAIDNGIYQKFIGYHADLNSAIQSHETCAFILWHRRYLLAMENMLRSLDPKFACLTIPYWNVMEHFSDQERGLCDSFGSCARVVSDLGGVPRDFDENRVYSEIDANGRLFSGRPIQNLKDDSGKIGIVRADLLGVEIPQTCSYRNVIDIYKTSSSYFDFARRIQTGLHDDVHDFVGGMMPTFASPSDPLFLVWHSFIDLLLYIWEVCNTDDKMHLGPTSFDPFRPSFINQNKTSCAYTSRAKNLFPATNITSDMYIKLGGQDIRNDPLIGKYFQDIGLTFAESSSVWKLDENEFSYDHFTAPMWNLMQDPQACPANDWFTQSPTQSPVSIGPTSAPDLSLFEQWISDLRDDLKKVHEDNPEMVNAKISFLLCTLNGSREIPSNDFRQDLLDGSVDNPKCNFFLKVSNNAPSPIKVNDPIPSPPLDITPSTITIDWFIPNAEDLEDFELRRAKVGDTIIFEWVGVHNVFIHPSGSCSENGRILVGSVSGESSYVFTKEDEGKVVFTCDIGGHCEAGQLLEIMVSPTLEIQSNSPTKNSMDVDISTGYHRFTLFPLNVLLLSLLFTFFLF